MAASRTAKGTAQSKATGTSWNAVASVTIAGGASVIVGITVGTTTDVVTGVTWNGTALTRVATSGAGATARTYLYALHNATAGTGTVNVAFTATQTASLFVSEVTGLTSTATDLSGSATFTSSAAITTGTAAQADEYWIAVVGHQGVIADVGTCVVGPASIKGQDVATSGGGGATNFRATEFFGPSNTATTYRLEAYDLSGAVETICYASFKVSSAPTGSQVLPLGNWSGTPTGDPTRTTLFQNLSLKANETLIVAIGYVSANSAYNDVKFDGVAMTRDVDVTNSNFWRIYSYYASADATGKTVDALFGFGAGGDVVAVACKLTNTQSGVDKTSTGTGSSTTPSSGSTATTAQNDEYVVGIVGTQGPMEDADGTWGGDITSGNYLRAGTTGGGASANTSVSLGYGIQTATGARSASKTGITSRVWGAGIATYKVAPASATPTPAQGPLTVAGALPTLALTLGLAAGALGLSGPAPSAVTSQALPVGRGSATITGQTPTLGTNLLLGPGALSLSGPVPTLVLRTVAAVPQGTLAVSGQAPSGLVAVSATPAPGTLALSGQTPALSSFVTAAPAQGALALSGPTASLVTALAVPQGAVTLSGLAPTAPVAQTVATGLGSLALSGQTPSLISWTVAQPAAGSLALSGPVPALQTRFTLAVAQGPLTLTGQSPALSGLVNVSPALGSLVLTGQGTALNVALGVAQGALTLAGTTPALQRTVAPSSGALSLTGRAAGVGTTLPVASTSLALSGLAPGVVRSGGADLTVELRQGTTVITTRHITPTAAWTTTQLTLTAPELAAITDWSDLRVALIANGYVMSVSWVQLDVDPSAPSLLLQPDPAALGLTGQAPAAQLAMRLALGGVELSGQTPTNFTDFRRNPGIGTFALAGTSNAIALTVGVSSGVVALVGPAPTVPFLAGAGSLELAGPAPLVVFQTTTTSKSPATRALALTAPGIVVVNVPVMGAPYAPCVATASVALPTPATRSIGVPSPTPSTVAVPTPASDPFRTCSS